jgi:LysM repeat protein
VRPPQAEAAPAAGPASELIAAVNQLRASYGLEPFTVDPILMAVAQAQNDYSISIGQITHYGPDGSRPRDQAIAAGYGGGATVFVSENIVQGTGMTPAEAVQWWTGDEPHLNTMIGQYYRDVGAGAGESDGDFYYTLMTGYVAGGVSANSTVPVPPTGQPAPIGAQPVVPVTPQPDGSIVHVVQAGQTLWTIAAVYQITLDELLSLNGLTQNAIIHAGDRLIIRAAATATAPAAPTRTLAPVVTFPPATLRPTSSPTPTSQLAITSPAGTPMSRALVLIGLAVVVLGIVLGAWHARSGGRDEAD